MTLFYDKIKDGKHKPNELKGFVFGSKIEI